MFLFVRGGNRAFLMLFGEERGRMENVGCCFSGLGLACLCYLLFFLSILINKFKTNQLECEFSKAQLDLQGYFTLFKRQKQLVDRGVCVCVCVQGGDKKRVGFGFFLPINVKREMWEFMFV